MPNEGGRKLAPIRPDLDDDVSAPITIEGSKGAPGSAGRVQPTFTLNNSKHLHVLRAACLRIPGDHMENRPWLRTYLPVRISIICGVRRKRSWPRSKRATPTPSPRCARICLPPTA